MHLKNTIAITLYKLGLIPDKYRNRARTLYFASKLNPQFFKSKRKASGKGFDYLDPMPSVEFLDDYYNKTSYKRSSYTEYPIRRADLNHFKMIDKFYKDFNLSSKKVLNFGYGHGGMSYLLHAANHEVYNFDPKRPAKTLHEVGFYIEYGERWHNLDTINDVNFKFDLIYSNSCLEHVHNIEDTMKNLKKVSDEKTIFFFEIPNCYYDKEILQGHTYYFTREFFLKSFKKVDFCKTFKNNVETDDESGEVIRFFTCSNIN